MPMEERKEEIMKIVSIVCALLYWLMAFEVVIHAKVSSPLKLITFDSPRIKLERILTLS